MNKSFFPMVKFGSVLVHILVEGKRKSKRYCAMSTDELTQLSDDELCEAVIAKIEKKVKFGPELEATFNSLNCSEKIAFSIDWLEREAVNGGLCQFFVNSSRIAAPLVSTYMGIIGAEDHKKLYDGFITNHGIDLTDLSFFADRTVDYLEKCKQYPFEDYDNVFYKLPSLQTYLKKYIRERLKEF